MSKRVAFDYRRYCQGGAYLAEFSGRVLVKVTPLFRPTEVDLLIGDGSKARSELGWQHRVAFDELVAEMVAVDFKTVAGERSRVLTHAD